MVQFSGFVSFGRLDGFRRLQPEPAGAASGDGAFGIERYIFTRIPTHGAGTDNIEAQQPTAKLAADALAGIGGSKFDNGTDPGDQRFALLADGNLGTFRVLGKIIYGNQ